jgi:uncharacterized membrane protein
MGHWPALIVFTLLAALELVGDKLPKTPARTGAVGMIARIVLGGLSGAALAAASGISLFLGTVAGSIGAVAGAFAGYHARRTLVQRTGLPDFTVALAEDMIAIVGGVLITWRV